MGVIMRRLILVAAVLFCTALGISAQDSLRNRGYADCAAYQKVRLHFEGALNWNSPVAVFFRQGTPDEGAPPPPPPDGWRPDGSPDWFKGGEIRDYLVGYREDPNWDQLFKSTSPMSMDFAPLTAKYTGPVSLTPRSPLVQWPYAANVEDDFATAYGVGYIGGVYEWSWLIDWPKSSSFDPFESTGVKDWLRHMGRTDVFTKWQYAPLATGNLLARRFLSKTEHVYVRISANRVTRDLWVCIRVLDGDEPHDLCRGFYVSAYYPAFFAR
jgi:hypothetical protein